MTCMHCTRLIELAPSLPPWRETAYPLLLFQDRMELQLISFAHLASEVLSLTMMTESTAFLSRSMLSRIAAR
jgi:hypothetical protein